LFLFIFEQVLAPGLVLQCGAQAETFVPAKGVVISELLPYARGGGVETEYVRIMNTGPSEVDLGGWRLCDEKHCAIFPDHWMVDAMPMVIVENVTTFYKMELPEPYLSPPILGFEGITEYPQRLANGSEWPAMLNDGDYLLLKDRDGTIVDAVAFGRDYQGPGWVGGPGPSPRAGWALVREFRLEGNWFVPQDTNSSADWPVYRTRRAEHQFYYPTEYHGDEMHGPLKMVGLRFPEDGGVLAAIIQNTTHHLFLNTYEFTSGAMADIIGGLAKRGVHVQILIEGHPVGGIKATEAQLLDRLNASGCKIRLMGSSSVEEHPGPVGLDHAKYFVLDNNISIIMSENLVPSALGTASGATGNRGWGVAMWRTGFNNNIIGEIISVFNFDWEYGLDLDVALPVRPHDNGTALGGERPLVPREPGKATVFKGIASFIPLLSPDVTEDVLLGIINGTTKRLYTEQLSCDLDWHLQSGVTQKQRSPLLDAVVAAARRGVEVKVLLDSNFLDTSDNDEVVAYLNEVANAEGLRLEARLADIPNITLVHNKGMVADDLVLVSSINWVDSAVRDNREVGVAIRMEGLDDLYISYFMKDWEPQAQPPGDGPGPTSATGQSPVLPICGSLLAFGAITLALAVLMRRGRHEQP
jgi:phosphatidylserine/phosphatidylglycerophosphate/cardiolipin synthase-like enzyme